MFNFQNEKIICVTSQTYLEPHNFVCLGKTIDHRL